MARPPAAHDAVALPHLSLPPDLLGWIAALLMVATFSCRRPQPMRSLAVATNLAFIGYGLAASLPPVLALHLVLLPVNLWRWFELTLEPR